MSVVVVRDFFVGLRRYNHRKLALHLGGNVLARHARVARDPLIDEVMMSLLLSLLIFWGTAFFDALDDVLDRRLAFFGVRVVSIILDLSLMRRARRMDVIELLGFFNLENALFLIFLFRIVLVVSLVIDVCELIGALLGN